MTGIHLIVPLEEDSDSNCRPHQRVVAAGRTASGAEERDGKQHTEVPDSASSRDTSSAVLSDDLRLQFETMKAVWRQAKRASSIEDGDVQEGSEPPSEELKRKERETAVETALAVDEEISRWQNGISELEAMLAAEDNSVDSASSAGSVCERGEQVPDDDEDDPGPMDP